MTKTGGNKFHNAVFLENMSGGAFVCRAREGHEILYANANLVRLFECDDYEDFLRFVDHSYDGMLTPTQLSAIQKEIRLQVRELNKTSGHLYYHIRTKKGNLHMVEEHWSLVRDPEEGEIFYVILISRDSENSGSDYDLITGLYGKTRFQNYVTEWNQQGCGKEKKSYAVAYLNFVNFKLLNIKKGVAAGDECLQTIADLLSQVFEDAFLARLSDDHFAIFTTYEEIFAGAGEFNRLFHETYGGQYDIIGKCGIYSFVPNPDFDVEEALSFAKLACDYIKYDSNLDIVEYSSELEKHMQTSEYVIRKFDEALEKGWIKIYYQPVIRSITGELCGMESLVRWIDPEKGFILPGEFIRTLEENRQIHKLDCFVVEQVCKCFHERILKKEPMVPVSVNFSRLDFMMCDMLQVVETAVKKYEVPRDYIHIEVTESMIASDEALMKEVIESFRKVGYEIWMDDFGSGYSSLTLLKDYRFDMLKLDMKFLMPFTEKAKDIVRSTITMAKDIGIKTLAEGVETAEQLAFLREIGCGQIQGYYYSRPLPIEDMFALLREKKIPIEMRKWRHFYEMASSAVRTTDVPLEVIEDDGKSFRTLYMNKSYRDQIGMKENMTLEEIDRRLYETMSSLVDKYRQFAEVLANSDKQETFYYTSNGNYISLRAQAIARYGGHMIIKASLYNLSVNKDMQIQEKLNSKIRELYLLYEVVLLANLSEKTMQPILGSALFSDYMGTSTDDPAQNNENFIKNYVFPTEQSRYREFIDFSTLRERVEEGKKGYLTGLFRIRQKDGSYNWREITLMMVSGTAGNEYLYCLKPHPIGLTEMRADRAKLTLNEQGELTDRRFEALICENLISSSRLKFFWKDKERRFLGASQSFMNYFGIKSLHEILGKTDEEMRWHVDDEPYRDDEMEVLQKGARVRDVPGQCIVKGVVHNIYCNKMPLYENGEIIGLVGFFEDREERLGSGRGKARTLKRDSATGLMNARAMVEAMVDYALQYHNRGRNYGMIVLQNARFSRVLMTYDEKFAGRVLREMGKTIMEVAGHHCVVARTKDSVFTVLTYVRSENEIHELAERIREQLEAITEVDGNPITMRIRVSVKIRTDARVTDENMYDMALREITESI